LTELTAFLNRLLTGAFDLALRPFLGLPPLWALLAISRVTGVLMLWIFGKVSDQQAIRSVRDRIRGHLLGMRIFGDEISLLLVLLGRSLRATATYMKYAVLPMLVMMIPVVLILIQMNLRFAMRPLEPGEPSVVTVKLRELPAASPAVELEAPPGVIVETPPVRVDALREVSWRIRAEEPGDYRLLVRAGGSETEKRLRVGPRWGSVSPLRTAKTLDLLLYPGEPPIAPELPVESIRLTYDYLPIRVFGFHVNWLLGFFVASIAFGFALRKPLGVEI
jgi:uncharacterized membrane protein (DUF106 family)